MKDLTDIGKFVPVKEKEGIELLLEKHRVVVLELNTAGPCQLVLQRATKDGKGSMQFLANVDGRETVKFTADGPCIVWPDADGAEVRYYTSELTSSHVAVPDAETYTRLADLKPKNTEVQRMMALALRNQERRFAEMMEGFAANVSGVVAENTALKAEVARGKADGKRKGAGDAAANAASGSEPAKPGAGDPAKPGEPPKPGAGDGGGK